MSRLKLTVKIAGFAIVFGWLALVGLGQWVLASYPATVIPAATDGLAILRTPLAQRVVIGDSRVASLDSTDAVRFIGYNGATVAHMERLAGVVCALSDVPVVFALGINDTVFRADDIAGSLATLEHMADACAPAPVSLAQAWPGEPGKPPLGDVSDPAAYEQLNSGIAALAERRGWRLVSVPELGPDHTFDGIHFMPDVARLYADTLAGPDAR